MSGEGGIDDIDDIADLANVLRTQEDGNSETIYEAVTPASEGDVESGRGSRGEDTTRLPGYRQRHLGSDSEDEDTHTTRASGAAYDYSLRSTRSYTVATLIQYIFPVLLFIGVACAFVAIGAEKYGIPCEKDLALWILVYGGGMMASIVFTIVGVIAVGCCGCATRCSERTAGIAMTVLSACGLLMTLLAFVWLIVGAVWVYDINIDHHICDGLLYYTVFIFITFMFCVMVLSFLLSLCLHFLR